MTHSVEIKHEWLTVLMQVHAMRGLMLTASRSSGKLLHLAVDPYLQHLPFCFSSTTQRTSLQTSASKPGLLRTNVPELSLAIYWEISEDERLRWLSQNFQPSGFNSWHATRHGDSELGDFITQNSRSVCFSNSAIDANGARGTLYTWKAEVMTLNCHSDGPEVFGQHANTVDIS